MFGLVTQKKYDELDRKYTNKLFSCNAKESKIKELEYKLNLEKSRSAYWKIKSENNNCEVMVAGSESEISYIKG